MEGVLERMRGGVPSHLTPGTTPRRTWKAKAQPISVTSVLFVVPSVIVEEEDNVLINPAHADMARLTATKVRRFLYDPRI